VRRPKASWRIQVELRAFLYPEIMGRVLSRITRAGAACSLIRRCVGIGEEVSVEDETTVTLWYSPGTQYNTYEFSSRPPMIQVLGDDVERTVNMVLSVCRLRSRELRKSASVGLIPWVGRSHHPCLDCNAKKTPWLNT
jgi:hypothetical protein